MFKYFYVIFCLGLLALFVMSLGQYAAVAFKDGWWAFTKDVASIVGSLAFPWAVWLYFKQRKVDHDEHRIMQLRELMGELTAVLVPEKLLDNQIVINSLLYRIHTKRMEVDERNRQEFDFSLRTHINQLLKNIQSCNVISDYSETAADYLTSNVELNDLDEKYRADTLWLSKCIVNSRSYEVHEFGTYKHISLDKGFSAGLLSQLILIAQPICIVNYTNSVKDTSWDNDKLKNLFSILPFIVAAYIYLAYSDAGKNLFIDLSGEK
jgi:hypothetical protein